MTYYPHALAQATPFARGVSADNWETDADGEPYKRGKEATCVDCGAVMFRISGSHISSCLCEGCHHCTGCYLPWLRRNAIW